MLADEREDFFYTAAVDGDAFWKAVGRAFQQARTSRGMDEKAVRKAKGPNEKTVKQIEAGERVQSRSFDDYAKAVRYPVATIFLAAQNKLSPAALLLAERLDGLSPDVRQALLVVLEQALRSQQAS